MKKIEDILTEEEKILLKEYTGEWLDWVPDPFGFKDSDDPESPLETGILSGGDSKLADSYGGPISSIDYADEAWRTTGKRADVIKEPGKPADVPQTLANLRAISAGQQGTTPSGRGKIWTGTEDGKTYTIGTDYGEPDEARQQFADQYFHPGGRVEMDPLSGLEPVLGALDVNTNERIALAMAAQKKMEEEGLTRDEANEEVLTKRAVRNTWEKLMGISPRGTQAERTTAFEKGIESGPGEEAHERAEKMIDLEKKYARGEGGVLVPREPPPNSPFSDPVPTIQGLDYYKGVESETGPGLAKWKDNLAARMAGGQTREEALADMNKEAELVNKAKRSKDAEKDRKKVLRDLDRRTINYDLYESRNHKNKIDAIILDETKKFLVEQTADWNFEPVVRSYDPDKKPAKPPETRKIINPASTAPDLVPDWLAGMMSGRKPQERSQHGGFGWTQETGVHGAGAPVPEYESDQTPEAQLAQTAIRQPTGKGYPAGDPRAITIGEPGLQTPAYDPVDLAMDIGTGGATALAKTAIAPILGIGIFKNLAKELGEEGAEKALRELGDEGIEKVVREFGENANPADMAKHIADNTRGFSFVGTRTKKAAEQTAKKTAAREASEKTAEDAFFAAGKAMDQEVADQAAREASKEAIELEAKIRFPRSKRKQRNFIEKELSQEAGEEATKAAAEESAEAIASRLDRLEDVQKAYRWVPTTFWPKWLKDDFTKNWRGKVVPRIKKEWLENNLDRIILEEIQLLKEALPATVPTENPQQNIPAMIDQIIRSGVGSYNEAIGSGNIPGAAEVVNATLQQVVELRMQEEVPPDPEEAVKEASNTFWDEQQRTPEAQ